MAMGWLLRLALAAAAAQPSRAAAGQAGKKPHVVFILADDYGWANLGVHRRGGSEQARAEVHTPALDELIDAGILLDRHYAYKTCSPSRSSLQSGRLPVHVNDKNTGVTVVNVSDPNSGFAGIPRNMTGMAEKLRDAGYRTHSVGKWDAGMSHPEQTPWGRGYDTWLGYYQHANDYWRASMGFQSTGELDNCLNSFTDLSMHNATFRGGVRDGVSTSPACLEDPTTHKACYEEELFKERALAVLNEHDVTKEDSPLFLFYSFHLLHTPLQIPESYLERVDQILKDAGAEPFDTSNRRLYAAMVLYMDEAVGEVVKVLKAKKMWDNTLIVFSSDNGGPIYEPGSANNHPLKGGKYSDWEGGVRVNAFVSGGFVPEDKRGSKFEGVMSMADWYGTLCELAGADPVDHKAAKANEWLASQHLPLLHPVDSVPQWGFMLNGSNGRPELHVSRQSLIQWPMKLVTGKQVYSGWQGEIFPNCSTVHSMNSHQGPDFTDAKVFDVKINLGETQKIEDKITWTQDCAAGCLFDVQKDPAEHTDLARDPAYADTLRKMVADLQRLNKDTFDPLRGKVSVTACEAGIDNGGFYGPYVEAAAWYSPRVPPTPEQHGEEERLRERLRKLNSAIAERGAEQMAQKLAPKIRDEVLVNLDKCIADDTVRAATLPATVVV